MLRSLLILAAVATVGACGDNLPGPEGPDNRELVDKLRDLDGVTVEERPSDAEGFTYYVLRFTQPVDHADPGGATFEQRVSLLHRSGPAPMVALTTGYWDYYRDMPYELTKLLGANQISIEHRYFGESRPEPADWSKLTIEQMAHDQHRIIEALRGVYPGAFLTTGGSKGGMTAVYHRRFYPDDVDGTVAYVAPISFGAPDPAYVPYLDTLGPPACREAVRALAVEMLTNRRAALLARAEAQATQQKLAYTRVSIGAALESSIASLEWAYWQYAGVQYCATVPEVADSDEDLFVFLDVVAPVTDSSDEQIALFDAYYHQAYAQLGFPDSGAAYLDPYLQYTDRDYDGALPAGLPAYDGGAAMHDIDAYVREQGDRLLFIYGEWDPWTASPFELGNATDSLLLVQAQGTHSARLARLAPADRDAAFARLEAWTGVAPVLPQMNARSRTEAGSPPEQREPRIPPAMLRALRAR